MNGVDWTEYKANPTIEARNAIIEAHLPLVEYHASKLSVRLCGQVETAELVNMGVFGLIRAIKGYEPERGYQFNTYCVPRIRGAMLDELRERDWVPRLVRQRKETPIGVGSLSTRVFDSDRGVIPFGDTLADDKAIDPASVFENRDLVESILWIVPLRYRAILTERLTYGLNSVEIAAKLGGTPQKVLHVMHEVTTRVRKWFDQQNRRNLIPSNRYDSRACVETWRNLFASHLLSEMRELD